MQLGGIKINAFSVRISILAIPYILWKVPFEQVHLFLISQFHLLFHILSFSLEGPSLEGRGIQIVIVHNWDEIFSMNKHAHTNIT